MIRIIVAFLLTFGLALNVPDSAANAQELPGGKKRPSLVIKKVDGGYVFLDGKSKILRYQALPKSKNGKFRRANYVHPLYDLSGRVITEDFPDDHPHQRGVFWAWHQIRLKDRSGGDGWLAENFDWKVVDSKVVRRKDQALELKNEVIWSTAFEKKEGEFLQVVNEFNRIIAHPIKDGMRAIDFEIKLLAMKPGISIGGSDDVKGYGGFSPRFRLPKDIKFAGISGAIEPIRTALDVGDWVDIRGTFESGAKTSGIVMMVHPDSAGYPQKWILRASGSMQNPVFPGRQPVSLSQKKPTVLRYRLLAYSGTLDAKAIETAYREFAATHWDKPPSKSKDKD